MKALRKRKEAEHGGRECTGLEEITMACGEDKCPVKASALQAHKALDSTLLGLLTSVVLWAWADCRLLQI